MNKATCWYKVWDNGKLVSCGKEATVYHFPRNSKLVKYGLRGHITPLCDEHKAFVVDAVNQREVSSFISSLPSCDTCFNLFIKCIRGECREVVCLKGKSNLPNWPFKHTKCEYHKEK